jgi:Flp pilus assembly protein TadD
VSPAGNPVDDGRAAVDAGRPHEALPILEQATRSRPDDAEAWNQLGRALNNLRRHPEARQAFETAAGLAPDSADILTNLGHVCRATGDLSEAARVLREATRLAPDHRRALSCLASVLVTSGETEEGLSLMRAAARAAVDDPWPSVQLGDALQGLGNLEEAESAYRHALKVSPDLSAAQAGLGAALDALGRYEEAESWLRRALESSPGDTAAIGSLCHVLELAGRPREVLSLIDAAPWDSAPPWVVATAARQHLRLGQPDLAEQWLTRSDPDAMDRRSRAAVLNVKAALLDSRGDYPGAFEAFTAANQTLPSGFDESGYPASVNRLMRFFSRDQMRVLPDSGCDSDRPVFIVGMPRSGTSLVEQILGSHSQVLPCGERRDFYRLPRRLSQGMPGAHWPECLAETSREQLAAAADAYIETAGPVGDRRITDKLPANFLNLGLVQLIFPRARVIYCRRDPMDTGLSCYQQDFQSAGMDFARRLDHIGLYQQGCSRLMEHWKSALELPIYTVDYEALVSSPESQVRQLVEFMGLDWEDACLQFHRNERIVRTASSGQVRQPIYSSSVGRWRRYENFLQPLRFALEARWPD